MLSKVSPILYAILLCFVAFGAVCLGDDVHQLASVGSRMSAEDISLLEEKVEANPDDVASRVKILGYYFSKRRGGVDARSAKERHILWLIENVPDSEVLGLPYGELDKILEPEEYGRAKRAWLVKIEKSPDDISVLRNASGFFLIHDRQISEECLLAGQKIAPEDPHWPASLALYSFQYPSEPADPGRKEIGNKVYQQYRTAYSLSDEHEKELLLSDLAKAAFEAGHIDEAKKYAQQLLDGNFDDWNGGNRTHIGNLVLGRVALQSGNIEEAKSRLLLAGKTNGSPQLNSFGPNMLLAKELLERGEKEVVLEYFELCKNFWASGGQKLKRWADDVKSNRTPRFGPNLRY